MKLARHANNISDSQLPTTSVDYDSATSVYNGNQNRHSSPSATVLTVKSEPTSSVSTLHLPTEFQLPSLPSYASASTSGTTTEAPFSSEIDSASSSSQQQYKDKAATAICEVAGCETSIKRHVYPWPLADQPRLIKWMWFVKQGRPGLTEININSGVCFRHFADDCFLNLKEYLEGTASK